MRTRVAWLMLLWCANASAVVTEYPAVSRASATLTLYSTTDTTVFDPVIRDFQRLHPQVALRYELLDAGALYQRFLQETAAKKPQADLLLSSAMDLQVKLVNDGYAAPYVSQASRALPAWAQWRDEAFGFTFEPAVMVFNRAALAGRNVPRSRAELLEMLRREPDQWRGRVGTYDIQRSSVGYLLATQDARQSSEFGGLLEAIGDVHAQVEEHTATLLDRLESGELAIGYNLLGSYAKARVAAGAALLIVYPQDYTLAVSRTAVLPRNAPNAAVARQFLDFLLSLPGQRILATRSHLSPIRGEVLGLPAGGGLLEAQVGPMRPIPLGPGLLVYLDTQKRQRMLKTWSGAITPTQP